MVILEIFLSLCSTGFCQFKRRAVWIINLVETVSLLLLYCRLMAMASFFLSYVCDLVYLLYFSSFLIHGVLKLMLILQGLKLVLFRRVKIFVLLDMN